MSCERALVAPRARPRKGSSRARSGRASRRGRRRRASHPQKPEEIHVVVAHAQAMDAGLEEPVDRLGGADEALVLADEPRRGEPFEAAAPGFLRLEGMADELRHE